MQPTYAVGFNPNHNFLGVTLFPKNSFGVSPHHFYIFYTSTWLNNYYASRESGTARQNAALKPVSRARHVQEGSSWSTRPAFRMPASKCSSRAHTKCRLDWRSPSYECMIDELNASYHFASQTRSAVFEKIICRGESTRASQMGHVKAQRSDDAQRREGEEGRRYSARSG